MFQSFYKLHFFYILFNISSSCTDLLIPGKVRNQKKLLIQECNIYVRNVAFPLINNTQDLPSKRGDVSSIFPYRTLANI